MFNKSHVLYLIIIISFATILFWREISLILLFSHAHYTSQETKTKESNVVIKTEEIVNHNSESGPELEYYSMFKFDDEVLDNEQVLDFAIVGFMKCGTSSLLHYLNNVPNQKMFLGEKEWSPKSKEDLYKRHRKYIDTNVRTGFKYPGALQKKIENPIKIISQAVKKPKLIILIRHPITHFQSNYNFIYGTRQENRHIRIKPPDPLRLIGHCQSMCESDDSNNGNKFPVIDDPTNKTCIDIKGGVCTTKSTMYHYQISKLCLTPLKEEKEWDLLDHHRLELMPDFNGTIFLIEQKQLYDLSIDMNDTDSLNRGDQMRTDLEKFIGLESNTLADQYINTKDATSKNHEIIDICEDNYIPIRNELIERGKKTSQWIVEYLLKSDRVLISSREYFLKLMDSWSVDPCLQQL